MTDSEKIILDLCGGTGAWSKPYKDAGYDVRVITLPEHDVRLYQPPENIYGILAAPPCTMFASAGARWKRTKEQMIDALSIVDACLRIIVVTNPEFWAMENPVGTLKRYLKKPELYFQPCDYGDPWTKKTCLWGKFDLPLKSPVKGEKFLPHAILSQKASDNQIRTLIDCGYLPGNYKEIYGDLRDRSTIRAITPPGFAKAFFEANR